MCVSFLNKLSPFLNGEATCPKFCHTIIALPTTKAVQPNLLKVLLKSIGSLHEVLHRLIFQNLFKTNYLLAHNHSQKF